jgi:predicted nucleotidyltransferase
MPAKFDLTPDTIAVYRRTMRKRQDAEQKDLTLRRERAREVVRQAARLLQDAFKATRVMVFGSLVHGYWFSPTSDIDLAAWGLKDEDYFLAVAKLQDISPEFRIDLIRMENCRPDLQEAILQQGKQL